MNDIPIVPDGPAALGEPYEMVSVRRAEPPTGTEGSEWHGYVITQGKNTIHGCRRGTLAAVTTEVEGIVVRLNERRLHKRGRTHVVLTPKKSAVR